MKKTIITYASLITIAGLGYANSPDLGGNYTMITDNRIEHKVTTDDLTGITVVDKYGVEVAKIHDLAVDPSNGEISTAYLAVGGIAGIGSSYVSLPYSELTYHKSKEQFSVTTTQSEINAYIDKQEKSMKEHEAHMNAEINRNDMDQYKNVGIDSKDVSSKHHQAHMNAEINRNDTDQYEKVGINRDDMDQRDNTLTHMWDKVESSLGINEEELADVEAEVRDDKLYLEGEVDNYELKRKIGTAFKSTTDLTVVNKIKVV